MPNDDDPTRADPGSLLEAVQRRRGGCLGAARSRPAEVGEAVLACLARDPRWDRQVEERAWLYAALAEAAGVEPIRLRAATTSDPGPGGDDRAGLATDVLALLARRGVPGGVTELRRYLGTGRDPGQALDALLPLAGHPEATGLLDDVLEAAATDERMRQALTGAADRWPPDWRDRLARFRPAPRQPPPASDRAARRAARRAADRARVLRAATDLGLLTDPDIAEWEPALLRVAPDLLRDDTLPITVPGTVWRCLRELRSPAARHWARLHAGLGDPVAASALAVLADTAEPSDTPRLRELLAASAPLGTAALYEQCALVPALARAGDTAAVPVLERIFDETVYSYLRARCATALARLSPAFPRERALECLDDCESGTRAVGFAHAALPAAREHLIRAAADPTETAAGRAAAAARLGAAARGAATRAERPPR